MISSGSIFSPSSRVITSLTVPAGSASPGRARPAHSHSPSPHSASETTVAASAVSRIVGRARPDRAVPVTPQITAIRKRAVPPSVSAYCRAAANWWPARAPATCAPLAFTCVDEVKTVSPAIQAIA